MTTISFALKNKTEFETQVKSDLNQVLYSKDYTKLVHCPKITKGCFEISNSVKTIGIEAFAECRAIDSILIPASVKTIRIFAFRNCNSLKSIILRSKIPIHIPPDSDIFLNVDQSNCVLYVPIGSKQAYQQANQWCEFENIQEISDFIVSEQLSYENAI